MKFMIQGTGWPVGDGLVPAGTVVDDSIAWAKGLVPPINAQALDDEAWQFMKAHYTNIGYGHLLGPPPVASK